MLLMQIISKNFYKISLTTNCGVTIPLNSFLEILPSKEIF
ncbi:hypothetical protein CSS_0410 [Campylobacter jejuni subsp. jejuni 305]|nr:hypothetical protein CSS_0410 [Campylobacter jejuni subsp. jejuni 305]